MMRFKFVSFDLNGVVLKPARSIGEIYCDSARKLGIVPNPQKLDENFIKSMEKMKNKYPHFGGGGGIGWESWWKKTVRMTFESSLEKQEMIKIEPHFVKMSDHLLHLFSTKEPWKLNEGITQLLDDLSINNIPIGAITNSDPRVDNILKDFGINHFLFIITSYESNMSKPDKRVFQLAETKFKQKIGHFDPNQAVHIGDSYNKDVLGALGAGWNAILIKKDVNDIPEEHHKLVFNDLHKVRDYLLNNILPCK